MREFLTVPAFLWLHAGCKVLHGNIRPAEGRHAPCLPGNDEGNVTSYYDIANGDSSKEKRALDAVYPMSTRMKV